jgi:hypothetical protein
MHSDDVGCDGGTSFKFTQEEIWFLIDILEMRMEQVEDPVDKGVFATLLKRFNKVQKNNNDAPVNLEGDDVITCYHCLLKKVIEGALRQLFGTWSDEGVREQTLYREMGLCCTILAKLSITSEDGDGGHWGSAAAAA